MAIATELAACAARQLDDWHAQVLRGDTPSSRPLEARRILRLLPLERQRQSDTVDGRCIAILLRMSSSLALAVDHPLRAAGQPGLALDQRSAALCAADARRVLLAMGPGYCCTMARIVPPDPEARERFETGRHVTVADVLSHVLHQEARLASNPWCGLVVSGLVAMLTTLAGCLYRHSDPLF